MAKALPVVRLFISSTFRDLEDDRNELAKQAVPQLRRLCEERGVVWSDVDLRWGVTEVQAERGETLPVCLAEIDRCRPYFICILGERYGWTHYDLSDELLESYPWLTSCIGASITEIEIVHAALHDQSTADHVWFYFKRRTPRSPAVPQRPKAAFSRLFGAAPSVSAPAGQIEPQERRRKLAVLKRRIRASHLPWRRYSTPGDLAQAVVQDLARAINVDFPAGSVSDPLLRETDLQEAYAANSAPLYVRSWRNHQLLDDALRPERAKVLLTGPAGCGKSALLANWSTRLISAIPDAFVFRHFVGATPTSTDWISMVRRLARQLCDAAGIKREIPSQPFALRTFVAEMLVKVSQRAKVLLIIDGVDHLENRDAARELRWLPDPLPASTMVIISAGEGPALDALRKIGFESVPMAEISRFERAKIIIRRLRHFGKRLDHPHVKKLVESGQTGNPLFLATVLDELRVIGAYGSLGSLIDKYGSLPSLEALYAALLDRYERDYGQQRTDLVKDALSIIWTARYGVSERELLDMLGGDGQPMPTAYWSPLLLAAADAMQSSSGLIGFANPHFRTAVEQRYLRTAKARQGTHRRFAQFLAISGSPERKCEELLWQLIEGEDWRGLERALSDLEFIAAMGKREIAELLAAWKKLTGATGRRMADCYHDVIEHPDLHQDCLSSIQRMLHCGGSHADVARLAEFGLESARAVGNSFNLAVAHHNLGIAQDLQGRFREAVESLAAAEKIFRDIDYPRGLLGVLTSKCACLREVGALSQALEASKDAEEIARELGDFEALTRLLNNKSLSLKSLGRHTDSLDALNESEKLARDLGATEHLITVLDNKASLLMVSTDSAKQIMDVVLETEQLARDHGIPTALAVALNNKSVTLRLSGALAEAITALEEAEQIAEQIDDRVLKATAMMNRSQVLKAQGNFEGAFEMFGSAGDLWLAASRPKGVAKCLDNQALLFEETRQPESALALRQDEEKVCRDAGFRMELAYCLIKQAELLAVPLGRPQEAQRILKAAMEMDDLADWPGVARYGTRVQGYVASAMMH